MGMRGAVEAVRDVTRSLAMEVPSLGNCGTGGGREPENFAGVVPLLVPLISALPEFVTGPSLYEVPLEKGLISQRLGPEAPLSSLLSKMVQHPQN